MFDGRPALVALYAPAALAGPGGGGGAAGGWPAAVYVLDCVASAAGEGPEAVVGSLLGSLRGLLEEPGVAKVVHGCEQVRAHASKAMARGRSRSPWPGAATHAHAALARLAPVLMIDKSTYGARAR